MNIKKIYCILLILCFVPCITVASGEQNLIFNPSFETSTSNFADGWQKNYPENLSLNMDATYNRTGSKSLKLSTATSNFPYTTQRITGVIPGAEYTYKAYVKRSAKDTGPAFSFEWYDSKDHMILQSESSGCSDFSENNWGEITGTEIAPEKASYLLLRLRMYGTGTVYWDDISFYMSREPLKMMSLVTDEVFYYSDRVESGTVTVTLNTDYHNLTGQSVKFEFLSGEEILETESRIIEENKLVFSFPMHWIAKEKTKYTFRCSLGEEQLLQNVYRYPRPKFIRKDGVYEEKGKEFHPVFMYGVPSPDTFQDLKDAGINLVQGYAASSWMQKCAELDMKQIVVLYSGAISAAGSAERLQATKKYVTDYKDNVAVFGWAVKDEPDIKPSTLKELEEAYVTIRNIDDNHPVWITCNGNFDTLRKYADVLSNDSYPYNNDRFSYSTASGIADSVEKANGKPVYSLLQAFEAKDSFPTSTQLGSMIYQSFWGGAKGIGFFKYHENDPKKFLYKTEKYLYNTELWPTVLQFSSESGAAFSVFVNNKEAPIEKNMSDDFYWYVKKNGTSFWLAAMNKSSSVPKTLTLTIDGIPSNYEVMLPDGLEETRIQIEGNKLQISLPESGYTFAKISAKTGFINSKGESVFRGFVGETVFPLIDPNAALSILAAFRTNGAAEELTGLYIGENEAPFIEGFHLEENTVYKLFSWDENLQPIDKTKYIVAEQEEKS